MGQLINKLTSKFYTSNRGMIFLNFVNPDKNTHACSYKCKFCCGYTNNYNIRLVPTNDEISEFVKDYFDKPIDIHITGGGDPLYEYEKNKAEFGRILTHLKKLGCTTSLVTVNYPIVSKYGGTSLKTVDYYIFSCEGKNEKLRKLCHTLLEHGKGVRITKIFNLTGDLNSINGDEIKDFVSFYKDIPVVFRGNFNYQVDEDTFIFQREKLNSLKLIPECGKNFGLEYDGKPHIGLYNNEVGNTADYDNLVRENKFRKEE